VPVWCALRNHALCHQRQGREDRHLSFRRSLITDDNGRERERHKVPYGATCRSTMASWSRPGTKLATWDPHTRPIITEYAGTVRFENVEEGVTVAKQIDDVTGLSTLVVIDPSVVARQRPRVFARQVKLLDAERPGSQDARHRSHPVSITFQVGSIISVLDGQQVSVGDVLARMPQESAKTRDITGGLPRVAELFEARTPKDARCWPNSPAPSASARTPRASSVWSSPTSTASSTSS
jgi:DNA-directed RNA polymerase subunit beta'